jgi:hypothetical protein
MTASTAISALAVKHAADVFVPECKDGPSAGSSHFRMDAWAMLKSWSNWKSWGYEVKVSRSDYQQDKKWTAYLPYCNEFYFVCPAKMLQPSEVPDPAGLMWVSSTGNRILTKKKAAFRSVVIPEEVYRYILMSRAKITRHWCDANDSRESRMDRWREALAANDEGKKIGRLVKGAIAERQALLECENLKLQARIRHIQEFKDELEKCGVDVTHLNGWYEGRRRAKRHLMQAIPSDLVGRLRSLHDEAKRVADALEQESPAETFAESPL